MCIHVFLGADVEVPTSKWSKDSPGFHVERIEDEWRTVKKYFNKVHVYYLTSHEGCGCGFEWDANEKPEDWANEWDCMSDDIRKEIGWTPEDENREYQTRQKIAEDLAALLKRLLRRTTELEVGVFESGGWNNPPTSKRLVTPDDLARGRPDVFPVGGIIYQVVEKSVEP